MKRDWDTIREILLRVEDLEPGKVLTLEDFYNGRHYEIGHHVELLNEAGLILASIPGPRSNFPTEFYVDRLTWDGHDLLESVRDASIWKQTRATIAEQGGGMTFEIVKQMAVGLIKNQIGI